MIALSSVSYAAGEFRLSDISLDVGNDETLVVLGPTGAGKTVLLELVAGFRRPSAGEIMFKGKDITRLPPEKRGIGMVYQDYLLFPHLSVFDNIAYGLRTISKNEGRHCKEKVEAIAEQLGISHLLQRRTKRLSGGGQQRVAFARTLIIEPGALLLDEPFSALDPNTKEKMIREMKALLREREIPVIYVTHDQTEALEMADRIAVMHNGRIVQIDGPDKIFNAPRSEFVANFVGVKNIFKGTSQKEGDLCIVERDGVRIQTSSDIEGDVYFTIRPEDIIVSRQRIESSARNSLKGVAKSISEKGPIIQITADCGLEITASVTKQAFAELHLTVGDEMFMTFKAPSVNVF